MTDAGKNDAALPVSGNRLRSWKEIAGYLGCSVITAQRWEKREGLPVRRHFHKSLGSAFAFTSEIDRWLEQRAETGAAHLAAAPGTPASRRPMLAVLPFENLTGDPGQEYLCDGITEETITEIGRLYADRMGVIARASVMHYKTAPKTVGHIARELAVRYLLQGSVRRTQSRVRVAVQLIDPSDQTHVWAQAYELPLGDVLAIQSEIAQAVAEKVGIKFELPQRAQHRSPDSGAFELYLKGRFEWYKLSRGHFDVALQYFQMAVEKDPAFAPAYVGIADVWLIRGDNGIIPAREAYPKTKAALSKALELDESLAETHVTLANCRFLYEWDWSGAGTEFVRAIELNPNSVHARFMYSDFLICMRRFDSACAEMDRVMQLDPFNPFFQCFQGWHLLYRQRNDKAIACLRKALTADPELAATHLALWGAFHRKRRRKEALAEASAFYRVLGDGEIAQALGVDSHGAGDYARAMRAAADLLSARSTHAFVPAVRIARLYAHAGDNLQALYWLEKAYDDREPPLVHLAVGWDWDSLRNEPRFQRLLKIMKFPS